MLSISPQAALRSVMLDQKLTPQSAARGIWRDAFLTGGARIHHSGSQGVEDRYGQDWWTLKPREEEQTYGQHEPGNPQLSGSRD